MGEPIQDLESKRKENEGHSFPTLQSAGFFFLLSFFFFVYVCFVIVVVLRIKNYNMSLSFSSNKLTFRWYAIRQFISF
jgi:hypothetical protein